MSNLNSYLKKKKTKQLENEAYDKHGDSVSFFHFKAEINIIVNELHNQTKQS